MSHLEERLEHDLNEIRDEVANMGASVEQAMDAAFRALLTADEKLAFTTILSDLPINRQMRKIDRMCHAFIAVHLPSAGHLRPGRRRHRLPDTGDVPAHLRNKALDAVEGNLVA